MPKVVTIILKWNGVGSTVMIDDVPIEGIVAVDVGQRIGNMAFVRLELISTVVVVKAETDDVTIRGGEAREG